MGLEDDSCHPRVLGSCRCGAVRVALPIARGQPWLACDCPGCRRAHGAAWAVLVPPLGGASAVEWQMRESALKLSPLTRCVGAERLCEAVVGGASSSTQPAKTVRRSFCGTCGAAVSAELVGGASMGVQSFVCAGILDDKDFPSGFVPKIELLGGGAGRLPSAPFYPKAPELIHAGMMLSGACACGACKFVSKEQPTRLHHCHCGICRKLSGTAFQTWVPLNRAHFRWQDMSRLQRSKTSRKANRFGCGRCGTTMALQYDDHKTLVLVAAGSLDDVVFDAIQQTSSATTRGVWEAKHAFVKDAPPWDPPSNWVNDGISRFRNAVGFTDAIGDSTLTQASLAEQVPPSVEPVEIRSRARLDGGTGVGGSPRRFRLRCEGQEDPIEAVQPVAMTEDQDQELQQALQLSVAEAEQSAGVLESAHVTNDDQAIQEAMRQSMREAKSMSVDDAATDADLEEVLRLSALEAAESGDNVPRPSASSSSSKDVTFASSSSASVMHPTATLNDAPPQVIQELVTLAGCSQEEARSALQAAGGRADTAALILLSGESGGIANGHELSLSSSHDKTPSVGPALKTQVDSVTTQTQVDTVTPGVAETHIDTATPSTFLAHQLQPTQIDTESLSAFRMQVDEAASSTPTVADTLRQTSARQSQPHHLPPTKTTSKPVAKMSRYELISEVFKLLDAANTGNLTEQAMLRFAKETGFDGAEGDWSSEYSLMCEERGRRPEQGIDEASFSAMLDDSSDSGCYCGHEELKTIHKKFAAVARKKRPVTPSVQERMAKADCARVATPQQQHRRVAVGEALSVTATSQKRGQLEDSMEAATLQLQPVVKRVRSNGSTFAAQSGLPQMPDMSQVAPQIEPTLCETLSEDVTDAAASQVETFQVRSSALLSTAEQETVPGIDLHVGQSMGATCSYADGVMAVPVEACQASLVVGHPGQGRSTTFAALRTGKTEISLSDSDDG